MSSRNTIALLAAAAAGMMPQGGAIYPIMQTSAHYFGRGSTPAGKFRKGATVRPRNYAEKRKAKIKAQRIARRTNRTKTKWR